MPDSVASQVAAGEVVERPASAVKELIENSIDAGARRIQVDIERGGVALIKVTDDGDGMCREDAVLAIERHATSKLRSSSDLSNLSTYGFRGEALPSIASVSRFRLVSCQRNSLVGTEILVEGGKLLDVGDAGNAAGTQVEIRNLFYNVPARRKFLRAQATEFGHIEEVVKASAIVNPGIAFTLRHGEREVIRLARSSRRIDRISDLFGIQIAESLIEFKGEDKGDNLNVAGWISAPGFSRRNRRLQYCFLNGRPIECAAVGSALNDAYAGLIDRGSFPSSFIFIGADPASIDVNVHPTKREVRFSDSKNLQRLVAESVQQAIKIKLRSNAAISSIANTDQQAGARVNSIDVSDDAILSDSSSLIDQEDCVEGVDEALTGSTSVKSENIERQLEVDFHSENDGTHKILALLDQRYLLIEGTDGLVIVHRRAAHERILYEECIKAIADDEAGSQALLIPVTFDLPQHEFQVVMDNAKTLARLGLRVESFGENTLKIDALPVSCAGADPSDFMDAIISSLCDGGGKSAQRFSDKQLAAIISHRAARYSEATSNEELQALVCRLMQCDMPYCDARGRPTMVQFSHQELSRRFGAVTAKPK